MKITIPLLLVLILTGCAGIPLFGTQKANVPAWDLRQEALNKLENWSLTGRIVILSGDDGWSATLHWNQEEGNYTMRFIAPLGQGTYQLYGDEKLVSFLTDKNELYQADDPEQLLQSTMGWSVPVHGLKYWIKGIPEPGIESKNLLLDEQGRMTELQQSGWSISISRYNDFDGTQLPSKLSMQNERIKLRLVIQDWKTNT